MKNVKKIADQIQKKSNSWASSSQEEKIKQLDDYKDRHGQEPKIVKRDNYTGEVFYSGFGWFNPEEGDEE